MADKKISDFTAATTLGTGDLFELETAAGNSRKITVDNLATEMRTRGDFYLVSELTPSGTGTVTFSSLPSGYRDLKIRVRGAGTKAATNVEVRIQFNADTTANYDYQALTANNASSSSSGNVANTSIFIGWLPAASGISNPGGVAEVDIFDFANATTVKPVLARSWLRTGTAASTTWKTEVGGNWRSASAITSVTVFLNGNDFTNAVVSLYASK